MRRWPMDIAPKELQALIGPTGAVIKGDYRYALWRTWDPGERRLGFVMLNPSTASATKDDPTLRKCRGFATRWGYGGLVVVNLYSYRATSPDDLRKAGWPVGDETDEWIREAMRDCGQVVCAWGVNAQPKRAAEVGEILRDLSWVDMMAIKLNKSGSPAHPLYQPYARVPVPFVV